LLDASVAALTKDRQPLADCNQAPAKTYHDGSQHLSFPGLDSPEPPALVGLASRLLELDLDLVDSVHHITVHRFASVLVPVYTEIAA
jgi:hypothetical protein